MSRPERSAEMPLQVAHDDLTPQAENARFLAFIQSENDRLAKVTTICSTCGSNPVAAPIYVRPVDLAYVGKNADARNEIAAPSRASHPSPRQSTK
jgi:hypothetical protein